MSAFKTSPKESVCQQMTVFTVSICMAGTIGLTALVTAGCSRPINDGDNVLNVTVLEDEVIVDKSFVYSNTPERYQPSYNLRGTLAPIEQVNIISPYNGYNLDVDVKKGDWVDSKQILAHLQSDLNRSVDLSAEYDYIDILTDEQTSLSEESISDAIEETLEEAIPDGIEVYEADDKDVTYGESNNALEGNRIKNSGNHVVDSHVVESNITVPKKTSTRNETLDDKKDVRSQQNLAHNPSANDKKSSDKQAVMNKSVVTKLENSSEPESIDNKTTTDGKVTAHSKVATNNKVAIDRHKAKSDELKMVDIDDNRPYSQSLQRLKTSLTFRSPIEGKVIYIDSDVAKSRKIVAYTPFMTIADTRQLQLVGTLPLMTGSQSTESQLSVGQSVNFKVYDTNTEFTGQISHITPEPDKGYLIVRAPVIPSADNKAILEYGMQALMTIEYGQTELGVRVPREAIHEANLDSLNLKYTRPVSPISGYVWVIEQDERLAYTPVEIVRYFPETDQFLVHGISNDSLVCTAELPKTADGKRLSIH